MTDPKTIEQSQQKQTWQKYFGDKEPADIVRGYNDEATGITAHLHLLELNPSSTEREALLAHAKNNVIWFTV